jgi:hypothetical protein
MYRVIALVLLLAPACMVSESSGPARGNPPVRIPPPPPPGDAPPSAPTSSGPLPAGIYDVFEHVLVDTCHPTRNLPPRVSLLKRHHDGAPRASIPVPSFGKPGQTTKRLDVDLRGYMGSGMSHPKVCPGAQHTYREDLRDVTATSFRMQIDYEVADGWDCPNPRPGPMCRTSVVYEYRLASAACPASCDGTVPGQRDEDVPPGPVPISCACR